jgi:hypothetical protein
MHQTRLEASIKYDVHHIVGGETFNETIPANNNHNDRETHYETRQV